jgi:hypothetical protein
MNNKNLIPIKSSPRVAQVSGSRSIKSIRDVAIELITNSEDEYEVISKGSEYNRDCLIDYKRGGNKKKTILTVSDKGRGMNSKKIRAILEKHGDKIKAEGSRGFNGRGLIDIGFVGDVIIESVVDKKYSKFKILFNKFAVEPIYEDVRLENNQNVTNKHIKNIRHGTSVTVEFPAGVDKQYKPHGYNFIKQIRHTPELRFMLSKENGKVLKGHFANTLNLKFQSDEENEIIRYQEPEVEILEDKKEIQVEFNGKKVSTFFTLGKSNSLLSADESDQNLSHYGILIKSKKTIHCKNFLKSKYKESSFIRMFIGLIECDYIDTLCHEYESKRVDVMDIDNSSSDEIGSKSNPWLIMDPERRNGLDDKHPFTIALYDAITPILDKHVKEEVDKARDDSTKIAKDTSNLLNKALKLLEDEEDDLDGISSGNNKEPFWVVPANYMLKKMESKTIYVYTKIDEMINEEMSLVIEKEDKKYLNIKTKKDAFIESKKGIYRTKFEIEGADFDITNNQAPSKNVKLEFHVDGEMKAKTNIEVYLELELDRGFGNDLEFENNTYTVRYNRNKKLKIFAKHPEITNGNNKAKIVVENKDVLKHPDSCLFHHIDNSNYSVAEIDVKGLKINGKTIVTVYYNNHIAQTLIDVEDNENPNKGTKYSWKITNDEFPDKKTRAEWEGTTLNITTKNEFVKKYRGDYDPEHEAGKYEKTPFWKLFLTELLSEKFAEKILEKQIKNDPDSILPHAGTETEKIVNDVLYQYIEIKKDITDKLHKISKLSQSQLTE